MTSFTLIEDLLSVHRNGSHRVAISKKAVLNRTQWLQKVALWQQHLQPKKEQTWALYHSDASEFSAVLFALWSLGKTVCLPGNKQPALVAQLAKSVDGFIGEFDTQETCKLDINQYHQQRIELACCSLDSNKARLQIYTSGSTGQPEAIGKTLRQLSNEVTHLHQLWGNNHQNNLVLATVSHQHIYGLLFKILWPLAEGWCIDTHSYEHLEEVAHHLNDNSPASAILITSPTHLTRLPKQLDINIRNYIHTVFSSGAPLPQDASLQALQCFNTHVKEIYGSTETGGIGWREQTSCNNDALWQALPGVKLRSHHNNGCLEVQSAHLPDTESWHTTNDLVEIDTNEKFSLRGRIDRIVKIEGKRASLDEIEAWLLQLPDIKAARLVLLQGRRVEIGAVIVLSKNTHQTQLAANRRAISLRLKEHLLQRFERPLLPRRWRYQEQLPVNTQGKIQQQNILNLFIKPRPQLPTEITRQQIDKQQWEITLLMQEDLLFFDGHFDKQAILPGVVQVHWAEHFSRELFSITQDFLRLEVIKFQKIIPANTTVILTLTHNQEKNKASFSYHSTAGQHSSGRVAFNSHD